MRAAGVFRRVVKCDVESLYPAVMLHFGFKPATDTLDVFLPLLGDLTRRRLEAKHRLRAHRRPGAGLLERHLFFIQSPDQLFLWLSRLLTCLLQ